MFTIGADFETGRGVPNLTHPARKSLRLSVRVVQEESMASIRTDRDTLLVTEAVTVTVYGVADGDTPVTLTAASPHGRLVRVVGADTTAITGSLPYSEIQSSRVLFVADGAWPTADASVQITGTAGDDAFESVTLTVRAPKLAVELDVDPATYLPVKNDTLTATVRVASLPEGLRRQVEVRLTQSYEFTFLDGSTGSRSVPLVRNAAGQDTARVQLLSKTWWGVATLRASVRGATASDTLKADVQVPIDSDGDTIADAWERDPANGGTLSLGGSGADGAWNEETSPGNTNHGDPFTKLEEYQGVLVGTHHLRLDPTAKEVFLDIRNAQAGAFVASELQSQLGLTVYAIDGVKNVANPKFGVLAGGTRPLEYVAPSLLYRSSVGVIFVTDQGSASPTLNGIVVQNGVYTPPDPSVPGGKGYAVKYGVTVGTPSTGGGISRIFTGTINNVWNHNSIPEASTDVFRLTVPTALGTATWDARYNGTDLNGINGNADLLNPFDLASSGSANNPEDGVVATFVQQRFIEANALHEVGHALGMSPAAPGYPSGKHPTSGLSVMREGPGPGRTTSFAPSDVQELNIK